jgi:predicted nucleic acid-binding protein
MIIDASVVFKWLVPEQDSDAATAWIGRTELLAPALIYAEVANALWKLVRRGEMAGAGAAEQLARLPSLVKAIADAPLIPRAFDLAVELGHPVYDCLYLAAAEASDDEYLTADARFLQALEGTVHWQRVRLL